jgi:import inner membrane translocase subunit TIM54
LVAAAIDYEPVPSPLPGSITRQIQSQILSKRRQNLHLDQVDPTTLPGVLSTPEEAERREVEGGVIVVGRSSLKEYLEGLKRGWNRGVDKWDWEEEIQEKIRNDGVFDPPEPLVEPTIHQEGELEVTPPVNPLPAKPIGGLGFLSRPPAPLPPSSTLPRLENQTQSIPPQYHTPPATLPPHPPLLLVPFTHHLGFKQFPNMIYSFFTEHHRVRSGAEAALALIQGPTRPFFTNDLDFERKSEEYYPKWYKDTVERTSQSRKEYYEKLETRLKDARDFADGKREMTKVEEKAAKVTTENELREERKKREMRWIGTEDGYEIVKPDSQIAWDEKWRGWLKVYDWSGESGK